MAFIEAKNADTVCVQELCHFEDMLQCMRPLGYDGKYLQKPTSEVYDGSAVFWKNTFVLKDFLELAHVNSWKQVCLCVFLEFSLNGNSHSVSVVSTHLKSGQSKVNEQLRIQQATTFINVVDEWLSKENRKPNLKLFVGDINSTSKGQILEIAEGLNYKSAYHVHTWPPSAEKPQQMVSFVKRRERELYDYVYFQSYLMEVTVSHCDELPSAQNACIDNTKSDHLPIYVIFCLLSENKKSGT